MVSALGIVKFDGFFFAHSGRINISILKIEDQFESGYFGGCRWCSKALSSISVDI